jgi:hypothetical protein
MGAQRVEWQAFGRMCLKGRNRGQAPSHMGLAVFIHGVSGAGLMWGGLESTHMGSAVFIHGVPDAESVWEGACPR